MSPSVAQLSTLQCLPEVTVCGATRTIRLTQEPFGLSEPQRDDWKGQGKQTKRENPLPCLYSSIHVAVYALPLLLPLAASSPSFFLVAGRAKTLLSPPLTALQRP